MTSASALNQNPPQQQKPPQHQQQPPQHQQQPPQHQQQPTQHQQQPPQQQPPQQLRAVEPKQPTPEPSFNFLQVNLVLYLTYVNTKSEN